MSKLKENKELLRPWQQRLHDIIYEAETPAGKLFDIILLVAIVLSVLCVMIESVPRYGEAYEEQLIVIEWIFTILFSVEYVARIISIKKPFYYIFSFYGVVDLLSIIPTYLGLFLVANTRSLMVVRSLRLLRVFRILKLGMYLKEARVLTSALKESRKKIFVFLFAVMMLTIILGTIMYLVETPESGFTSIPRSIYWAIVTLTTVGYGDITPATELGQLIAAIVMILGYSIIAVPTGIVSRELFVAENKHKEVSTTACRSCSAEGHDANAIFCKYCGAKLHD